MPKFMFIKGRLCVQGLSRPVPILEWIKIHRIMTSFSKLVEPYQGCRILTEENAREFTKYLNSECKKFEEIPAVHRMIERTAKRLISDNPKMSGHADLIRNNFFSSWRYIRVQLVHEDDKIDTKFFVFEAHQQEIYGAKHLLEYVFQSASAVAMALDTLNDDDHYAINAGFKIDPYSEVPTMRLAIFIIK